MKLNLFAIVAICLVSNQSVGQTKNSIDSLGWIAGCWELNMNGRVIAEQWMIPAGGTMMGISRTVKNEKTIEFEFVRLVQQEDGSIDYVARPSGQDGASFRLKSLEGEKAVFENLEHDFPQRIIYEKRTADSLVARIEGTVSGKLKGIDFPMRKVKCVE